MTRTLLRSGVKRQPPPASDAVTMSPHNYIFSKFTPMIVGMCRFSDVNNRWCGDRRQFQQSIARWHQRRQRVHEASAYGVHQHTVTTPRARVCRQHVPIQATPHPDRRRAPPLRETGEDLVPEQASEVQEGCWRRRMCCGAIRWMSLSTTCWLTVVTRLHAVDPQNTYIQMMFGREKNGVLLLIETRVASNNELTSVLRNSLISSVYMWLYCQCQPLMMRWCNNQHLVNDDADDDDIVTENMHSTHF